MGIQENYLLSEKDILAQLSGQKDLYAPLEVIAVDRKSGQESQADAKITLGLRGRKVSFLAEVKARTAPKVISEGLWRIKKYAGRGKQNCILVVPYLTKTILEILNKEGLSGIDLSGNYLIQTQEMVAVRLDQKNLFPESQSIRKIFSGNSSMVGRLFLTSNKRYGSVNEVCSTIQALGGSLSLSAVSKVLAALEDELIIEKGAAGIILLQPEKLLQKLEEGYRSPKISSSAKLKLPSGAGLAGLAGAPSLSDAFTSLQWALTGESSANRYAIMADSSVFKVYITDYESLLKYQDDRFYNVLAQKTEESFPYFDAQEERGLRWASPIQCYLELSKLDKREKEVATTVRQAILAKLK